MADTSLPNHLQCETAPGTPLPAPNIPLSNTGSALWTCLASVRAPGEQKGGRFRAGKRTQGHTPGSGLPYLDGGAGGDDTRVVHGVAVIDVIRQGRALLRLRWEGDGGRGVLGGEVHVGAVPKGLDGISWRGGKMFMGLGGDYGGRRCLWR